MGSGLSYGHPHQVWYGLRIDQVAGDELFEIGMPGEVEPLVPHPQQFAVAVELFDLLIGKFYFKREQYLAAADRFRVILDEYPHSEKTEEILYLLGRCLRATANPDEAQLYFDRLLHEFPDGKFARDTRKFLKKKNNL